MTRRFAAGAVARLRGLRGMTWSWGVRTPRGARNLPRIGVVAQDVEKVFPELVTTGRDGYKRVDYVGLIGPLVEAVKELDRRLSVLEAENESVPESPPPRGQHESS